MCLGFKESVFGLMVWALRASLSDVPVLEEWTRRSDLGFRAYVFASWAWHLRLMLC